MAQKQAPVAELISAVCRAPADVRPSDRPTDRPTDLTI
jgi:hypothetical protein